MLSGIESVEAGRGSDAAPVGVRATRQRWRKLSGPGRDLGLYALGPARYSHSRRRFPKRMVRGVAIPSRDTSAEEARAKRW